MNTSKESYFNCLDHRYGYYIAESLTRFVNSDLGGRNAGSRAEHQAADWLVEEMKKIGLSDVQKEAFPCDTWQFNGSTLKVISPEGEEKIIKPYSYASGGTSSEGITAELVYAGKGTRQNYQDMDVCGKVVLIDIDMKKDWWISMPTLEAELHGAAAIINNCTGGYSQKNEDTMNTQDFSGPMSIPSVNISKRDAAYLKELLGASPVHINLVVDNQVTPGGTSYNITGKINGKCDDEIIIVGDHYDCHFSGFQDDNCGVAMTLEIARAMVASNYQPERTIVFILHGAEEWSAMNSHYDFAHGAWHQVFTLHPEWTGKALVYLNFEHPAHEYGDTFFVNSTPEFDTFLQDCYENAPERGPLFKNGYSSEGHHIASDTDAWSYAIAGIPAMVNGRAPINSRNIYYDDIYHSNFDDAETFDADVFLYNLKFYGALTMEIDRRPALPLDFRRQAIRLKLSLAEGICIQAGLDIDLINSVITEFQDTASEVHRRVLEINNQFLESAHDNAMIASAKKLNRRLLDAYKMFFDMFYKLDFDNEPIFGHELPQKNIQLLTNAIPLLQNGLAEKALEKAIQKIDDNLLNRYFDRETVGRLNRTVIDAAAQGSLFWATDRLFDPIDLADQIESLTHKITTGETDFSSEIIQLQQCLSFQNSKLREMVEAETEGLKRITKLLADSFQ